VPTAEKVQRLLTPSFAVGGKTMTRADYFAYYGGDGPNGIGTKAAMVGWLLAEAEKADIGMYSKANHAFLTDLADGAPYAIDLIGTYGQPGFAL
jgi:serralysin